MSKKCILVVEDDSDLREAIAETLRMAAFAVETAASAEAALQLLKRIEVDMIVSDVNMGGMDGIEMLSEVRKTTSHLPVLIITAYSDVSKAVAAMRLGAVDFMIKPFEPMVLVDTIKQQVSAKGSTRPIVVDPVSRKLYQLAKRVAVADSTVLLLGDSGVGKEVVAKFIHEESPRSSRPFVAINCAAIPENMLEATMFGHEKGAYTGAHGSRAGKFEQADGGTLLLDEISEMDLGLQAKLLRVIQEREVERLGGKGYRKVDVRIVATTNRNLVEYVQQGRFREDLYYRIAVFPIKIEALCNRVEDIVPLADHLANIYSRRMNRTLVELDDTARVALREYSWPGNVRELENVIQRALILQPGNIVRDEDLFLDPMAGIEVAAEKVVPSVPQSGDGSLEKNLKHKEFQLIIDVLKKERGSRSKTAEKLGISARTLRYKLAKMRDSGIDVSAELATY
ncbi:MAG: sigma-54 dependent transcriptional regulator [Pseudomonadales bacterium]|nr:sigma-54 dependent transcriptional regulator [Pseudomonadales bacterium]